MKLDKIIIKQFSQQDSAKCGWKKVRSLPAGSLIWYPSQDHIQGTDTYGDPANDLLPWSIPFNSDMYDQLMFTTNDFQTWVIYNREIFDGLLSHPYINTKIFDIQSSLNPTTQGSFII